MYKEVDLCCPSPVISIRVHTAPTSTSPKKATTAHHTHMHYMKFEGQEGAAEPQIDTKRNQENTVVEELDDDEKDASKTREFLT